LEPFLNLVILFSLQQGLPTNSLGASMFGPGPDMAPEADPLEFIATDMSLSTLYLHELHHRQVLKRQMSPVLT
jgi:autophagy-related protein 9